MLDWVLPRRNPLLAMEIETLQESHDLDADNIKFLKTLCDNDGNDRKLFWTTAWLLKPLVDWGSHVSNFLHGCPCRKPCVTDCPLKGRRAIEMAWAGTKVSLRAQENSCAGGSCKTLARLASIRKLKAADAVECSEILYGAASDSLLFLLAGKTLEFVTDG